MLPFGPHKTLKYKKYFSDHVFPSPSWSVKETFTSPKTNQKIDPDRVKRLSRLALLSLSETRIEQLTKDIGDILVCVDNIKECDTTGVLPLLSVASDDKDETKNLNIPNPRPYHNDNQLEEQKTIETLSNAPKKTSFYFTVPKVKDINGLE